MTVAPFAVAVAVAAFAFASVQGACKESMRRRVRSCVLLSITVLLSLASREWVCVCVCAVNDFLIERVQLSVSAPLLFNCAREKESREQRAESGENDTPTSPAYVMLAPPAQLAFG